MFFITVGTVIILSVLGIAAIVLFTDNGKDALGKVIEKIPDAKADNGSTEIIFDKDGKPSIKTKTAAIRNLTIRSKQTLNETLYVIQMTTMNLSHSTNIHELNGQKKDVVSTDQNNKNAYVTEKLQENVEKLTKIVKMSNNSDKVIRIGVENVAKYKLYYQNIDYRREFFLAKLDELKTSLNDTFLKKVKLNESKEIYAQLVMIKSISYYLDYDAKAAYRNYELAQRSFPSLRVIDELKKEYKDIAPHNAQELKFAYVLVASVPKSEANMQKTADKILAVNKYIAFRKKNYNLYLSINSSKIRVYTILEYHSKDQLTKKMDEIESIEKTALLYDVSRNIPKEYILKETRKKIYVYRTSDRPNDKYLVEALKKQNYKQISANGYWGKKFYVYAVYYDGNSCDENDLENFLDAIRDAINSHAVKAFAYQQSKSKKIQNLFEDKNLKYIVILEKNAYVKSP